MIILDNDHRFKDNRNYGQILKRMRSRGLRKNDWERINTRVLEHTSFNSDSCHACPTNKDCNLILAGNTCEHVMATHSSVNGNNMPPRNIFLGRHEELFIKEVYEGKNW